MRTTRRFLAALLAVLMVCAAAACGTGRKAEGGKAIRLATLKGPTGIGTVRLMERNQAGELANRYDVTLCASPTEVLDGMAGGHYDIAACPLNMAAVLYNKTEGHVRMLAINALGALYLLSQDEISGVADLAGRRIVASGQGATPEYLLDYILERNGLTGRVTVEYRSEHAEVSALAASAEAGDGTLYLLPEPFVTTTMPKNANLKIALNLSEAFETLSGVQLAMGCVVVRSEFAASRPEAVKTFLAEYADSVAYATGQVDGAAALCERFGVIPKAAVAKRAIPRCGIALLTGRDMRATALANLNVLFGANPKSVGGRMPAEDFFYGTE